MNTTSSLQCNRSYQIRLHMRTLGRPRISEFTALANAQATFGQYDIYVKMVSGICLPNSTEIENQTLTLRNVNVGACTLSQNMTGSQSALFSHGGRQGVLPTDILCYWVDRVTTTSGSQLAGCASHPASQPSLVVSAAGSPWTLAHEIGHVLGLRHVTGTTNLMSTPTASISANPPRLSDSEVRTVRSSRLCVPA